MDDPQALAAHQEELERAIRRRETWAAAIRIAAGTIVLAIVAALVAFGFLLKDEVADRNYGQCVTLAAALQPIRDIITEATKPAPLEGLTPERAAVVTKLNV